MKNIISKRSVLLNQRTLKINSRPDLGSGCYLQILKALDSQLTAMLTHYHKVTVIRFDLHCTEYTDKNHIISKFLSLLTKELRYQYPRNIRSGFVWAREKGQGSQAQHYHLALFLNGDAIRSPIHVKEICTEIWINKLNQLQVQHQWGGVSILERGDFQSYSTAFYWLSYLAKVNTKGHRSPTANDYSSSRIKANPTKSALYAPPKPTNANLVIPTKSIVAGLMKSS